MEILEVPEGLELRQGGEVFVLALPRWRDPVGGVAVRSAAGLIATSPDSPGKTKALAVLARDDAQAVTFGLQVVAACLKRRRRG